MKWLIIAVLSLSTFLVALSGAVPARAQGPVVFDDASGIDGRCTASGSTRDQMIVCTDLRPGRGTTVTDPGAVSAPIAEDEPSSPASAPDGEPVVDGEPAPDGESAPETTETAVATATDQDADNASDELEPGLGLDPTNPDTDADGVADGDEGNLYGTDPTVADTDGDGVSDGGELFDRRTDPLVWDTNGNGASDGGIGSVADSDSLRGDATDAGVTADAAPGATSEDGDTDRLADTDEAGVGTDPANPDSDGDGSYDGDEVNLDTDPLEPTSFPAN